MTASPEQQPGSLKGAFGSSVELVAEDGTATAYEIKAEFQVNGRNYAALQSAAMRREEEVELFRVLHVSGQEPELESIEDDEEWEAASEAYDDLWFKDNEQP
jgi:uncharacterized protein YrzB (UPF0473 family)